MLFIGRNVFINASPGFSLIDTSDILSDLFSSNSIFQQLRQPEINIFQLTTNHGGASRCH